MGTLDLLDYRRRVADIYDAVRGSSDPEAAWRTWVAARQDLFASHPQSPWEPGARSEGRLHYFPYDPRWRLLATITASSASADTVDVSHSADGRTPFVVLGTVPVPQTEQRLTVYWLASYGGGVFLPFRDLTNGGETYGGGRYLLDTVKGADLGGSPDSLVLDFNFAYHPSCVHSPRWSCPLAPPENRLTIPVKAGERLP